MDGNKFRMSDLYLIVAKFLKSLTYLFLKNKEEDVKKISTIPLKHVSHIFTN